MKIYIIGIIFIALLLIKGKSFFQEELKMNEIKKYTNPEQTDVMVKFRWQTFKDFMFKVGKVPERKFEFEQFDSLNYNSLNTNQLSVTWFGHSSGMLEIGGKLVLFDPVFSNTVGPVKGVGTKRFHKLAPVTTDQLPHIDVVIISHDHYDHLDKTTIKGVKNKVDLFVVPEGVTKYLLKWGIPKEKIVTLKWWDEHNTEGLQIVCTPSRHFSGRGMFDRNTTLWCSYVIKSKEKSIYFSGDSGYQNAFKTIGDKYGPFDLSIMECGQYNADWAQIHMHPIETVQASIDLQSKMVMPIHWGAFSLSVHTWSEPVEIFLEEAKLKNVPYITPQIGLRTMINGTTKTNPWWEEYIN